MARVFSSQPGMEALEDVTRKSVYIIEKKLVGFHYVPRYLSITTERLQLFKSGVSISWWTLFLSIPDVTIDFI
jgi:hypothetical protein